MSFERARWQCRHCGQKYTTRDKRDAHERTHRINQPVIGSDRP